MQAEGRRDDANQPADGASVERGGAEGGALDPMAEAPHAWMVAVIEDLRVYAEENRLASTARMLGALMPVCAADAGVSGSV